MTLPLVSLEFDLAEAHPELRSYPLHQPVPDFEVTAGNYLVRLARSLEELDAILKLRFEVFNLELGEGLESSFATGRDCDEFDSQCHHLLVWHRPSERIVGTYRVQTWQIAQERRGYYTASEFEFSGLPSELLESSVEVGRVAIAKEHRATPVLFLLWKGLARYLQATGKRWLMGPCSLPTTDPEKGWEALAELERRGRVEHRWPIVPQPGFECPAGVPGPVRNARPSSDGIDLPPLFDIYLRYGGKVCGHPVLDQRFKTIDFFMLFDAGALSPKYRKLFFE